MKYTIHYEYCPTESYPFWASSNGERRCGDSFAHARKRLIERLKEIIQREPPEIPQDEEIEL